MLFAQSVEAGNGSSHNLLSYCLLLSTVSVVVVVVAVVVASSFALALALRVVVVVVVVIWLRHKWMQRWWWTAMRRCSSAAATWIDRLCLSVDVVVVAAVVVANCIIVIAIIIPHDRAELDAQALCTALLIFFSFYALRLRRVDECTHTNETDESLPASASSAAAFINVAVAQGKTKIGNNK